MAEGHTHSKRSEVWKYFSEINSAGKKKVKCNLCSLELAYAGGSTGTMTNHIKYKHISTSLAAKLPKEGQSGQPLKQASITAYRSPVMSSMTKEKYQRCTQKLVLSHVRSRFTPPSVLWRGEDLKSFVMS